MSSYFGLSRSTRVSGFYRACQRRSLVAIAVLGFATQAGMGLPAATAADLNVSSGTTTISSGANPYDSVVIAPNGTDTATLALTGGTLAASNESAVGLYGNGLAEVSNGTWTSQGLSVGTENGSYGTLTMTGGNVSSNWIIVGRNAGSQGSMTVSGGTYTSGPNDGAIRIGPGGTGTLTVSGSGSVVSGGRGVMYVGYDVGSQGTLNVNGGSVTANNGLVIGSLGTGTVNASGGLLTASSIDIVDATLNVLAGGQVTVNNSLIATGTLNGTLRVTDGGSYNGRDVAVGYNGGTGTIDQTGGTVSGNLLSVGTSENSTGTVSVSAGTMTMNQINIGAAGSMTVNGTVNSLTGPVTVGFGGMLGGAGTIGGNTSIAGGHILGDPAGLQTIGGALEYKNGGLRAPTAFWNLMASDSTSPASYGHVQVSGDLGFRDTMLLMLAFDSVGSTVAWSDAFWSQSEQWTVYGVGGTLSGFDKLSIDPSNWLDSNGRAFGTYLAGSSFSLSRAGNDIVLNYNTAAVPEIDPSSFGSALAMVSGALALLERRARRAFGRQTTV